MFPPFGTFHGIVRTLRMKAYRIYPYISPNKAQNIHTHHDTIFAKIFTTFPSNKASIGESKHGTHLKKWKL
jgi:hypothetical protein